MDVEVDAVRVIGLIPVYYGTPVHTVKILQLFDPLSSLGYPMITHTPLVASNLPIKKFGC